MKSTDLPALVGTPFAENGIKTAISQNTSPGTNAASYNDGFPAITMTELNNGGLPPRGSDFNQILYELAKSVQWSGTGALYKFSADFATKIGGYPKGSKVIGSDGDVYECLIDDNMNDPVGGAGWVNKGEDKNTRELWRRSLAEIGLNLVEGSFQKTAIVNSPTDAVWDIDGAQCYTWAGDFPHTAEGEPGAGWVPASQLILGGSVYAEDFFIAGEVDSTGMINRAAASGAGELKFRGKVYYISEPLYHDGNQKWVGVGSHSTRIIKTTATRGVGSNLSRSGRVVDSYDKNAILIVRHRDNNYAYNFFIEGIRFEGKGYTVENGIYAPRISHYSLRDVYIFQTKTGWLTHDAWLGTFTNVDSNSNSVDPSAVPVFAESSYGWSGSVGFKWENDGTGGATGTSLTATGSWARDCHIGWDLYGLQYSTLNSCAADNITGSPYRLSLCKLTMNSCATENSIINLGGSYLINGGSLTMNSCQSQTQIGSSSASSATLKLSGRAKVILNACVLENYKTPNNASNIIIEGGSSVINNESTLPTNGNAYTSYDGGSRYTEIGGDRILMRNSSGSRVSYNVPSVITTIDRVGKQIASSGTPILTIDGSNATSVKCVAVRLKVCWYDGVYPTGMGLSDIEVVCHDAGDGIYRQSVNTSVNTYSGNGITSAPEYTLSRSGSAWTLTMIPSSGDLVCRTLTAEIQNQSGFIVEIP